MTTIHVLLLMTFVIYSITLLFAGLALGRSRAAGWNYCRHSNSYSRATDQRKAPQTDPDEDGSLMPGLYHERADDIESNRMRKEAMLAQIAGEEAVGE